MREQRSLGRTWGNVLLFLLIVSSAAAAVLAQDGDTKEKMLAEFYPYQHEIPHVEGITPGMVINMNNAHVAAEVLPPEVLKVVQAGDVEITVQATTDVPIREEYIAATLTHAGQATLTPDGMIQGYVSGLPFPLIDPADPEAGRKIGWNLRYRDRADSTQSWGVTTLLDGSGTAQRSTYSLYVRMYGMHRVNPEHEVLKLLKKDNGEEEDPVSCLISW